MKLEQGDTLLMIGDSITEGKKGAGYAIYTSTLFQAVYPQLQIKVINKGIGGNTVPDLKRRWQEDVLDVKHDWLSIMIGVNDLWRQYYEYRDVNEEQHLAQYEAGLRELIESSYKNVKGLILLTPFYIEPNKEDPVRILTEKYGAVVKKLAAQYGAIFVDSQKAIDELLQHYYSGWITGDRVHPRGGGHMAVAIALLKSLGFAV